MCHESRFFFLVKYLQKYHMPTKHIPFLYGSVFFDCIYCFFNIDLRFQTNVAFSVIVIFI